MESSLKELAGYRMERAKEMLSAAEGNLEIGQEYCVRKGKKASGKTATKTGWFGAMNYEENMLEGDVETSSAYFLKY